MFRTIFQTSRDEVEKMLRFVYFGFPDRIKYGTKFNQMYKLLNESQYWDVNKHEEYQMSQLKRLINHAYNTVPYYNRLFNNVGIRPNDIKDFSDIKKIPYLTKEIIRTNRDELVSTKYKKSSLHYVTTGGSTGIPMGFYIDRTSDRQREWAFISHMWKRIGYDINRVNRSVVLRGRIPRKGIYEYRDRDLILSSYKLTEDNMKRYVELIAKFNPDFIQAYPSSISILSDYINSNGIKMTLSNLKSVICASENIYDFQRENIEKAFNVKVYSFYGHSEHAVIGGECENSSYYHLQSEYGYTELISEKGQDVTSEDGIGEIVATGFNNYVMPFIRYKTKDLAVNTNQTCECGRGYKLVKRIEGREQEYIFTKDGNKSILTGFYGLFDEIKEAVEMGQFYQDEKGVLEVRIVKRENYSDKHTKYILNKLGTKYGNNIDIKIKFVDEICRTSRGKYRFMVQKLEI